MYRLDTGRGSFAVKELNPTSGIQDVFRFERAAFAAGIPITELRAADGAGLEEMFLALTAESQRESTQHGATEGAAA